MTDINQSAVDLLKQKISEYGNGPVVLAAESDPDLIALANVGNGTIAKYVWHSLNVDWNPEDHPRDPNTGEFAKAPGGYIFGKAKSANFKMDGKSKSVELAPGDVAFKTNAGNVLVSHPDGSYTLHHKVSGKDKTSKVPAGSVSKIAQMAQDDQLTKIGENPGVSVPAASKAEAEFKLEHPSEGVPHDISVPEAPKTSVYDVEKPVFKKSKFSFTNKQYAEYQEATEGLLIGPDSEGNTITAGSWVDVEGKPYLVYPSPYADKVDGFDRLSVYRWVSTKQQASNLVKDDIFTLNDLSKMKVISDPTGKPYGVEFKAGDDNAPIAGSLMSQAATVSIPNTSVAHKKHVEDAYGSVLISESDFPGEVLADVEGKAITSGDWLQVDGKPIQVHSSPNEGFVAVSKWVSTKLQASGNTYDFPESIVATGILIPDPTGDDYTPVVKKSTAKKIAFKKKTADAKQPSVITPAKTGVVASNLGKKWSQYDNGEWIADDGEIAEAGTFVAESLESVHEGSVAAEVEKATAYLKKKLLNITDNDLEKAPANAQFKVTFEDGVLTTYTKKVDGEWYDESDLSAGYTSNYLVQTFVDGNEGEDVELVLGNEKLMKLLNDAQTADDVNLLDDPWAIDPAPAHDPSDETDLKNYPTDSGPLMDWEKELLGMTEEVHESVPTKNLFVHPASGETFELAPGDKVFKHKTNDGAYIIVTTDAENPIHFWYTTGKKQKAKASHKGLDKYYVEDNEYPGQHATGDLAETIISGQKATADDINGAESGSVIVETAKPSNVHNYGKSTSYKKNAAGFWESSASGKHLTFDGYDVEGNTFWDYAFYPPNTYNPNTGVSLTPAPVETDIKPAPKGKKSPPKKVEELPNDWTLPGGKVITLKPGEFLYQATIPLSDGSVKDSWFQVTPGKTENTMYLSDASTGWNPALSNATPAQFKKYAVGKEQFSNAYGEASFDLVAAKAQLEKAEFSYANYPEIDPKELLKGSYYEDKDISVGSQEYAQSRLLAGVGTKVGGVAHYSGGINNYASVFTNDEGNSIQWYEGTLEQQVAYIADLESILGSSINALTAMDSWGDPDKAEKAAHTKVKNSFITAHRVVLLAKEYTNPDSDWSDDKWESELEFAQAKTSKPGVSIGELKNRFPIAGFVDVLNKAEKQRKFKASLSDLSFDPYNAKTEDYDKFAKKFSFSALPALSPDDQKLWVLHTLGDPSLTGPQKNAAKKLAAAAQTKLQIATLVAGLKQNENTGGVKPPLPNHIQGATLKATLKKSYKYESPGTKVELANVGAGEWSFAVTDKESGDTAIMPNTNDAVVVSLINTALSNGDEVESSEELAYSPILLTEDLKAAQVEWLLSRGVPNGNMAYSNETSIKAAVAEAGASFPNGVALVNVQQWVRYNILGDYIGQYNVEAQAWQVQGQTHPDAETHIGSPLSPMGQVAYKAFASQLLSTPDGLKYLTTGNLQSNSANTEFSNHLKIPPMMITSTWKNDHPYETIASFAFEPAPEGKAPKPLDVSDDVWAVADSLTPQSDYKALFGPDADTWLAMTDSQAENNLLSNSAAKNAGLNTLTAPSIPPYLKKVALWSLGASDIEKERSEFLSAIAAKAKAGEFLDDKTPVWISPNGDKYPISPGAQVWNGYGDHFIVTGPPAANGKPSNGFTFQGNSKTPMPTASWTLANLESDSDWNLVFTMPNPVTWEQAKQDNPEFDETLWATTDIIDSGKSTQYTHHLSGPLLTAELKKNATLQAEYPALYVNHKNLPEHIRQAVLSALEKNHAEILKALDYKTQNGHYASMAAQGLFEAGQPWMPHLSKGQITPDLILTDWSPEAKNGYVDFFDLNDHGDIPAHLNSLLSPEQVFIEKSVPSLNDLSLTYVKDKSKGMHSGKIWVDQDGNEWMSKAFGSDPNGPARVDAETYANSISALYGFNPPIAYATKMKSITGGQDNKYSYIQHMKPATGDFSGKGVNNVTQKQLQQAMAEHVVDWIVANHDTHAENLMIDPSGNVFGIDKGQAFKHFPNDKLAVGYLPPENGAAVWYDQFYYALQNGQIDKKTADEVTKHVLRIAQKVSKDKDEEYRGLLNEALKNRQTWPDQFSSREAFIDGMLERKHSTFTSFVNLYKDLYDSSPYEWDIDTENLNPPTLDEEGHSHIAVSQSYADAVKEAAIFGKSLFFSSDDLEDSHVAFSTVTGDDGKPVLTGEAKIRADGDKKITEWLEKQTVEHQVSPDAYNENSSYKNTYAPYESGPNYADQPNSGMWFANMVQYSKTVSSHNAGGDKAYNKATVAQANAALAQLQTVKELLEEHKKENPDTPFSGSFTGKSAEYEGQKASVHAFDADLVTMEQQDAWEAMINTYIEFHAIAKAKEGSDEKVTPHFTQPVYKPSPKAIKEAEGADDTLKPVSAEEAPIGTVVKSGPHTYTKSDDTSWKNQNDEDYHQSAVQDAWKYMTLDSLPEANNISELPEGTVVTWGVFKYIKNSDGNWERVEGSNEGYAKVVTSAYLSETMLKGTPGVEFTEPAEEDEITAEVTVGTKVLKVTYRTAASKAGSFNLDTGEVKLSSGETSKFDTGNMYEIDFGNTVIEYRPWENSGVGTAQQGLLKFRKKDWDGDAESIDEVLDVLRHMGLDLDPATEESMELFYWRHVAAIISDRTEKSQVKYTKAFEAIKAGVKPGMTPAEELAIVKPIWSDIFGKDAVDKVDWKPQFSRHRLQAVAGDDEKSITVGRPYWVRPDFKYKTVFDSYQSGLGLPASSLKHSNDALKIAKSGSYLSSEERYRILSQGFQQGWSSSEDVGHGSSAVVYIRQGQHLGWSSGYSESVYYHPRILNRVNNYAFDGDNYGDMNAKKNTPFDLAKLTQQTSGGNELLVKYSTSVMDDVLFIQFANESDRKQAVEFYKKLGITNLHGFPIEDLFVTSFGPKQSKIKDEIWKGLLAEEGAKA